MDGVDYQNQLFTQCLTEGSHVAISWRKAIVVEAENMQRTVALMT
jgi:hypothetical protein